MTDNVGGRKKKEGSRSLPVSKVWVLQPSDSQEKHGNEGPESSSNPKKGTLHKLTQTLHVHSCARQTRTGM